MSSFAVDVNAYREDGTSPLSHESKELFDLHIDYELLHLVGAMYGIGRHGHKYKASYTPCVKKDLPPLIFEKIRSSELEYHLNDIPYLVRKKDIESFLHQDVVECPDGTTYSFDDDFSSSLREFLNEYLAIEFDILVIWISP